MRVDVPSSARLAEILPGAVTWVPYVSSWLGGTHLADVPVASGRVQWSTRREVQGSVDLVVPRSSGGVDWRPGLDVEHPLARFGQTLHVGVRVGSALTGQTWDVRLGTFLIMRTEPSRDVVRVSGVSMMQRVVDDRLTSPVAPRSGGTLASEARRLLPAALSLRVDTGLTNRACPAMSWGESRVDALYDIARAWPARLREDVHGGFHFLPPLDAVPDPLETLTDGVGSGTALVVGAYEDDSREGVYNRIVARGQETTAAGMPAFQSVVSQSTGPLRAAGPYGVVTRIVNDPLITSKATARAVAQAALDDSIRPARTVPVVLAPDPRWECDDALAITADGATWWGYVSGVDIPLYPPVDGDMRMDLEVA